MKLHINKFLALFSIIGLLLIQFLIYKQERITLQIFPQPSTTQEGFTFKGAWVNNLVFQHHFMKVKGVLHTT